MAQATRSSYVKAVFDFVAVESGDLAVREGDVIRVVETLDDGVWIRGELNQKIGVLPANHTEPFTQPTTPQLLKAKSAFDGDRDGDLSFALGETIEFVERVDAEWTRGRARDREGIFPTSFVEWAPMEQEQQKKTKSPTPPPVKPKPRKKLRPRSMANALDAQDSKESDAIRRKSVGNFIDSDTPPPVKPKPALKPKPKPKPKVIEKDLTSDEKTIPIIKRELVVGTKPVARKRFISQGSGQDVVQSSPRPRITSNPTFLPSPSPPLIAPKPAKRNIDGGGVAVRPKPRPKPRPRPLTQIILDDDDKEDDDKREDNVLRKRRQSLGDDSLLTSGDDSKLSLSEESSSRDSGISVGVEEEERQQKTKKNKASDEDASSKAARKRLRIIDELLTTEKSHFADLDILANKMKPYLYEQEIDTEELDLVFGNVADVAKASSSFLATLEKVDPNKGCYGKCFLKHADELKEAYATYSCNHEAATVLLEKYEADENIWNYFTACIASVEDDLSLQGTASLVLKSLLIKPIQRILKYPLLLRELVICTPDDHKDKLNLSEAAHEMSIVAQEVNERKRRKELVQHYHLRGKNATFFDKIGNASFHSLKKRYKRTVLNISQGLGIRDKTVDEDFVKVEVQFRELENAVHVLIKDVTSYLAALGDFQEARLKLCRSFEDLCDEDFAESFLRIQLQIRDSLQELVIKRVQKLVLAPLKALEIRFERPRFFVKKRDDKRLDYDALKRKAAESKEKAAEYREELLTAQRTYEALNTELLSDLPQFITFGVSMLQQSVRILVTCHRAFARSAKDQLAELVKEEGASSLTKHLIAAAHKKGIILVAERLAECQCVPRGFVLSLCSSPRIERKKGNDRPLSPLINSSYRRKGSAEVPVSPLKLVPPRRDRERHSSEAAILLPLKSSETSLLSSSLPDLAGLQEDEDIYYRADYDFDADEPTMLDVKEDQFVKVLSRADEEGNTEWWLVEVDGNTGYVPSSYLSKIS